MKLPDEYSRPLTCQANGQWFTVPVTVTREGRRLWFEAPYEAKEELKVLRGSKWDNDRRQWSAKDCWGNWFQIRFMAGEDPYAWWDRPLERHDYERPLWEHQREDADRFLTYHYQILAGDMGVGKTLIAQEVMERTEATWWWVGPKTSLPNMQREFRKWNYRGFPVEWMTYEGLVKQVRDLDYVPGGVVFDECSKAKNPGSRRSKACQFIADEIRNTHHWEGYVLAMSGTPSPRVPTDWWSVCEIVAPGWLREGHPRHLEKRVANVVEQDFGAGPFTKVESWKEDEVAYLHERLKGLVIVRHAKDCLELPELTYETRILPPTDSVLRVGRAIVDTAELTVTGLQLLRELSDGFQYREDEDGNRIAIRVPCPKDDALRSDLADNEEQGRIVIFAGFRDAVDRCVELCHEQNWDVVRCDGRGLTVLPHSPSPATVPPLDYWANRDNSRVAFVAHPESGGMSFTLTEAQTIVVWSNSWKPEYRTQLIKRIHRPGQTKGCKIIDYVHLPSDQKVLDGIKEGRRLELMTLGEIWKA